MRQWKLPYRTSSKSRNVSTTQLALHRNDPCKRRIQRGLSRFDNAVRFRECSLKRASTVFDIIMILQQRSGVVIQLILSDVMILTWIISPRLILLSANFSSNEILTQGLDSYKYLQQCKTALISTSCKIDHLFFRRAFQTFPKGNPIYRFFSHLRPSRTTSQITDQM